MGTAAEWVKLSSGFLAVLAIVVFLLVLLHYHKELRGLLGGIKQVKYKEFAAEFDSAVGSAFTAAAEQVWKRSDVRQEYLTDPDPDLYFSDSDFTAAKHLANMMPIRSWSPIIRLRVRRNVRSLVYDLSDQYRKVRAEPKTGDRIKRASAVVARMRILTFAAYPMLGELIAADRTGERVAAIAFLQVKPCFKASSLQWLGERISLREGELVQYHSAGALLVACRNAERGDMEVLNKVIKDARHSWGEMPKDHRSERAGELLKWCADSLRDNPYSMNAEEV